MAAPAVIGAAQVEAARRWLAQAVLRCVRGGGEDGDDNRT